MVTYTEDVNNSVIVIRNVPATVCTECGNIWHTGTIAAWLEEIVDRCVKAVATDAAGLGCEKPLDKSIQALYINTKE